MKPAISFEKKLVSLQPSVGARSSFGTRSPPPYKGGGDHADSNHVMHNAYLKIKSLKH